MTEQEWLTSEDPAAMLAWVAAQPADRASRNDPHYVASDRKLRLFACACCRSIWHLLTDVRCRECIEAAERYADDVSAVIRPFYADAAERFEEMDDAGEDKLWQAVLARHCCFTGEGFAGRLIESIVPTLTRKDRTTGEKLAALLRDIVGNPWRPVILVDENGLVEPKWHQRLGGNNSWLRRSWLTPAVLSLAQSAYDERGVACVSCNGLGKLVLECAGPRNQGHKTAPCKSCHGTGRNDDGTLDPVRLGILADALEESGCGSEELLDHLRGWDLMPCPSGCTKVGGTYRVTDGAICPNCHGSSGGVPAPHFRGCWALDLILNKE